MGPPSEYRVLLVVEWGRAAVLDRVRAAVSSPRVRLEIVVAHEVRRIPAEAIASTLRDYADLPAAHASVLGHVVAGQHLNFLNRVHVLDADDRAVGSRADRRGAVDGDVALAVAAAVDAEASGGETREAVVVEAPAHDAGLQAGDTNGIPPVERDLLDVLRLDRLSERGVALEQRLLGGDGDLFGQRARGQREVNRERAGGVELHAFPDGFLEALELGADVVASRGEVGERIEAAGVGHGDARVGRLGLRRRHGRAGHHPPGRILDDARDLSAVELRERGNCRETHCHEAGEPEAPLPCYCAAMRIHRVLPDSSRSRRRRPGSLGG